MQKKILVTGATGFIGNYVVSELLKTTDNITILVKNKNELDIFNWKKKVKYIEKDIYSECANFFELCNEPDLLIHLAWEGLPNYDSMIHLDRNYTFQVDFLKNIIENGLKDLFIAGTCFEYGLLDGCLSENITVDPIIPYAIAKNNLRKYLEILSKKRKFTLKWARLFYMYGKGQSQKSILSQLDNALYKNEPVFNMSGGEQIRDYLPVEKMAEYIVKIALQNEITGIINCCSGKPLSIRRLIENYLLNQGKSIELNLGYYPYVDYEPLAFWGNTDKLIQILKLYDI